MLTRRPIGAVFACATLLACQDATVMSPPAVSAHLLPPATAGAAGGGYYEIAGLPPIQFSFAAVQMSQETAVGHFRVFLDAGSDGVVDVAGTVICLTQDPVHHRAWVGAIVTRNVSTAEGFQDEIHQPGGHVWFRVLDEGDADRTSFIGFKGAAGIDTSPEYCAARIWPNEPAPNARTWPVIQGNITVRP